MATLTDKGIKDGTLIGNPNSGDYFRFMDTNNSELLTLRDEFGVDTVYGIGVLSNRIVVTQANVATTLGGTIDSTKEYFLDGIIDMTGVSVTVPSGGIDIRGYNNEISGLECADNTYTMFSGATSGNVFMFDVHLEVTGTSSKLFDLVGNTGNEAYEVYNVNYNNCTSIGELDNFRQGLEGGTGRFGGTPSLILSGTWTGGFRISSSIVRGLDDAWTGSLFEEGTAFTMDSRFLTDINCDLGLLNSLLDFKTTNFMGSSLLQLNNCIVSRKGVIDPTDTNITPNMTAQYLESIWRNNQGLDNTYVGGTNAVTTQVETTISVSGTYYTLAGTWTSSDLQHFDTPANNQLRNLGTSPRDFKIIAYIILKGGSLDECTVRIRKYDSSAGTTSTVYSQLRAIENTKTGDDISTYSMLTRTTIDKNDYIYLDVANNTDTTNVTALLGSFISIEER